MMEFSFAMLNPLVPEMFFAVAGLFLLVLGVFHGDKSATHIGWLTAIAFAVTAGLIVQQDWNWVETLGGMFVMDSFAGFVKLLLLAGLIVSVLLSLKHMEQERFARFEYPILILFAGLGMMIMVSSHDMLALYVGLELQSLALYVLASIRRDDMKSSESGLKYFVLGAISSGMLLFGISLIYGYTGSTNFGVIGDTLSNDLSVGALIGMVFILAGMAFKVSAVPFHMWTPDVYEGAPTSVTAFFALVPKLAAMALLTRLLFEVFPAAMGQWQQILWLLSVLSLGVGAFAGLLQDNLKRLLAYSSIGNMGFALMGLASGTLEGVAAMLLYMVIYMVMTAGTFGILLCMRRDGRELIRIGDLAGLSRHAPMMAYALAILMFSMAGIPPLAGFFGKFMVLKAAVGAELYALAILGVLASVVSAYYYLRIIKIMFFDDPVAPYDTGVPFTRHVIIGASSILVCVFVFIPVPVMETVGQAVRVLVNA